MGISGRKGVTQALALCRSEACAAFISFLEGARNVAFATEVRAAASDYELIAEILRSRILDPLDPAEVHDDRELVGWRHGRGFADLVPQFWDLVSLLPFREAALRKTLSTLLEEDYPVEGRILDAGCGTGLVAAILLRAGFPGCIQAYDINLRWLAAAADRKLQRLDVRNSNIRAINENCRFDAACCYMVLHHVPKRDFRGCVRKLFKALRPDGVLSYTDIVRPLGTEDDSLAVSAPECKEPLKSGQLLHISPVRLPGRKHLKPHPRDPAEEFRNWRDVANLLSEVGFAIERMDVVDEVTVHFKCRKPDIQLWADYSTRENRESDKILDELLRKAQPEGSRTRTPYQFTLPVMAALWHDLMGLKSAFSADSQPWWRESETASGVNFSPTSAELPREGDDIRAIAFFSWERDSRQFLVRRAWPHRFHIISYSSVFAGWGTLGRMLEEFEADGQSYLDEKGYSFLDRVDLQRTLPFAGDFKSLDYEAALAVPVALESPKVRPRLLGAFLIYLRDKRLIPVHTGSNDHRRLSKQFAELGRKTVVLLQKQDSAFRYPEDASREEATAKIWRDLVTEGSGGVPLVIAEVLLSVEYVHDSTADERWRLLDVLSSGLRAMLSGPDTYAVKESKCSPPNSGATAGEEGEETKKFSSCLLVAARPGMTYEALRDRILALIGPAGGRESVRGLRFSCSKLGGDG